MSVMSARERRHARAQAEAEGVDVNVTPLQRLTQRITRRAKGGR